MPLVVRCFFFHLIVMGYFWIAEWYVNGLMVSLPFWLQSIIGIMYLMGLLLIIFRIDLLLFVAKGQHFVAPLWLFFLRSFVYYFVALGVPVLLLYGKERMPYFISSYLIFVYFVVLVNCVDYAFPSYGRYKRLVSARKWPEVR